jgi:hypothetical protein
MQIYNRGGKCLQRGKDWLLIQSRCKTMLEVFTARYELIDNVKQIYNRGGKCLQRGTD